jgi:TolB-like protein/Flp pilus assembly protein TadD
MRSLAVLPQENLSGDPAQEYLADGMTDELITGLGQIGALRVISRTTAMQYKKAKKSLPQIAKELNVEAAVEGSVVRSGDRIRIAAQLFDAPDDKQLWARSYEGEMGNVLGWQSQVASAVAEQIRIKLTAREQTQLADVHQVNPRAYEAYLKGHFFEQNTAETLQKSMQFYRQAVELDPKFARAYVGLARSNNFLAGWDVLPAGQAAADSDAAVAKALELEPDLAEAYAERAWTLHVYHWDFPGADRDFRHSLELDPGSSDTLSGLSANATVMGRFDESLQEIRRAIELDPLSLQVNADYARALWAARNYDEAIAQSKATLELDPNFKYALYFLGEYYGMRKEFAEAHKIWERYGGCDASCVAMRDEIYGAPGVTGAFDA